MFVDTDARTVPDIAQEVLPAVPYSRLRITHETITMASSVRVQDAARIADRPRGAYAPRVKDNVVDGNAEIAYRAALTEVLGTLHGAPLRFARRSSTPCSNTRLGCVAPIAASCICFGTGCTDTYADVNAPPEIVAFNIAHPIAPGRGTMTGRAALEGRTVHAPDVLLDPEYTYHEAQRLGGFRATLAVPMLREGLVVGVINMLRDEPRPFSEAEIELVGSFADQAVIALAVTNQAQTIERQRSELARFLSPQVSSLIASPAARSLAPHRR